MNPNEEEFPEDGSEDEPTEEPAWVQETEPENLNTPQLTEKPEQEESIHVALPGEQEKKRGFSKALREALDESAQELAEIKAEPMPEQSEIDVAVGKSRFWSKNAYFIVGIFCMALAAVGAVTCVTQGIRLVRKFTSSGSLREELEDRLYPVAAVDLPAFENADELDENSMMAAAMLDLLMYGDLSKYARSFDMISIPAEDVAAAAARMFDAEPAAEFSNIQAPGVSFYYDAGSGCYSVPVSPAVYSYSPEIQKIQRTGDNVYTVTVDYCVDTAGWQEHSANYQESHGKTMEITMQEQDGNYRIMRIVNISEDFGQGL